MSLIHTPCYPKLHMSEGELNNNKGAIKRHKTYERNHPFFGARSSINICFFIIPLYPLPIQLRSGLILKKMLMLTEKCAPPFCQLFLAWFRPKQNIYLLL